MGGCYEGTLWLQEAMGTTERQSDGTRLIQHEEERIRTDEEISLGKDPAQYYLCLHVERFAALLRVPSPQRVTQ